MHCITHRYVLAHELDVPGSLPKAVEAIILIIQDKDGVCDTHINNSHTLYAFAGTC